MIALAIRVPKSRSLATVLLQLTEGPKTANDFFAKTAVGIFAQILFEKGNRCRFIAARVLDPSGSENGVFRCGKAFVSGCYGSIGRGRLYQVPSNQRAFGL